MSDLKVNPESHNFQVTQFSCRDSLKRKWDLFASRDKSFLNSIFSKFSSFLPFSKSAFGQMTVVFNFLLNYHAEHYHYYFGLQYLLYVLDQ